MKLEKEIKLDNLSFFCGTAHFNCIIKELNQSDVDKLLKLKNEDRIKLTLEVEEPILDESERKYLSGVIRPFRDEIKFIEKKDYSNEREYLWFNMKNEPDWSMPLFEKGTMYKNLKLNKEYELEDLGL